MLALAAAGSLAAALLLAPTGPAAPTLNGHAAVFAAQPFDSPVKPTPKPTHTPKPTPTPKPTATPVLGLFLSPLGTPLPTATLQPRAWLPVVIRLEPLRYGWQGIGVHNLKAPTAIAADWYYNWGFNGAWVAANGDQAQSAATLEAQMAAALVDPAYVPMIWCSDDVNAGISPETAAGLARDHPGRVWLLFNEPDNARETQKGCGWY